MMIIDISDYFQLECPCLFSHVFCFQIHDGGRSAEEQGGRAAEEQPPGDVNEDR
jgi:hypothetical protein